MSKIGIKQYFSADFSFDLSSFIPVFHKWIQTDAISDHIMIDVADYSHIPDGPGIMLICHEGNFSIDQEDRPGLLYIRKQPVVGDLGQQLKSIIKILANAQKLLSKDPHIQGDFSDQFSVITNDRLRFPNNEESQIELKEKIESTFNVETKIPSTYPGSRLSVNVSGL